MNINPINSMIPHGQLAETVSVPGMQESKNSGGFASYLNESLGEVNSLLGDADKKSMEMAVGKTENLHDAMITFEKAESALKLLVQVRNRALEAYHEIMRMQV
jgi:flagellar hook-basal body complex protein FliE